MSYAMSSSLAALRKLPYQPPFPGLPTGRLRSNLVAARLVETEDRTQQTGNPGNGGNKAMFWMGMVRL